MKKIFITGEEGSIAKTMAKLANNFDCQVMRADNELKTFQNFKARDFELDFTNPINLEKAIIAMQPDVIVHAGAYVNSDFCLHAKNDAVKTNVYGTQNIVDMCNKYGIKLIYLSTTAIFDIKDYSRDKCITEETIISPHTLYGITKYAGELIVSNTCQTDNTILRPVFGFGDFPDDINSAITKFVYHSYNNIESKLHILLDKNIAKSYYRVENIASIILQFIQDDIWNEKVNIGEYWIERKDWRLLSNIIESYMPENFNTQNIIFYPHTDYLGWHNISNVKMLNLIGKVKNEISFNDGLKMLIESVKHSNALPYWYEHEQPHL